MPAAHVPAVPHWTSPVAPLVVVRSFRAGAPFAAGGHRGIDLAAEPGHGVAAPCGGRVTFRGTVAGGPPTVTMDCGPLRATLQRVAPSVAVGAQLARGARVGVATDRAVDLSARRHDGSYVDPAGLLQAASPPEPPVAAPRTRHGGRARPIVPRAAAQAPAHVADRALVTPDGASSRQAPRATRQPDVDVPLGLAGAVAMAVAGSAWVGAALRRRRGSTVAGRANLARVQR